MTATLVQTETITFEQPLNEHIRACLRLEHLFNLITEYQHQGNDSAHRIVMHTLQQILNVTDRPDIRSKLNNALIRQSTSLSQLLGHPNVDRDKLNAVLDDLDALSQQLQRTHGRFGSELRKNEFLATIRQYQANPGGACNFCLPAYQSWLQRPPEQRANELGQWIAQFDSLRAVIELLLQLVRTSDVPKTTRAQDGFYQQALDANQKWQLVRVSVPQASHIYPEISVGRHRLVVRFNRLPDMTTANPRGQQVNADVEFLLSCCKI